MDVELPKDLLAFLSDGKQLVYDDKKSQIGKVALKAASDLKLSTIRAFPGCQNLIDDPYGDLDGCYQIEAVDLIGESELFPVEGLLCWIVPLRCFGQIDPEHGDVYTFPRSTWTHISKHPAKYLSTMWKRHLSAKRVLPWLHFPFQFDADDFTIQPYGETCPVHNKQLTQGVLQRNEEYSIMRMRALDDWQEHLPTEFPCAGVPLNSRKSCFCQSCRDAESNWLTRANNAMPIHTVAPSANGWVTCPECDRRFQVTNTDTFRNGVHMRCGAKIKVAS